MKYLYTIALAILMLTGTGCYSTSIVTGKEPSAKVVKKEWNLIFLYGLIPIGSVDVEDECPAGVAQVDTKLSFLNQLAGFLTAGLVTPTSVTVICAAE